MHKKLDMIAHEVNDQSLRLIEIDQVHTPSIRICPRCRNDLDQVCEILVCKHCRLLFTTGVIVNYTKSDISSKKLLEEAEKLGVLNFNIHKSKEAIMLMIELAAGRKIKAYGLTKSYSLLNIEHTEEMLMEEVCSDIIREYKQMGIDIHKLVATYKKEEDIRVSCK